MGNRPKKEGRKPPQLTPEQRRARNADRNLRRRELKKERRAGIIATHKEGYTSAAIIADAMEEKEEKKLRDSSRSDMDGVVLSPPPAVPPAVKQEKKGFLSRVFSFLG